MPHPYEFFHDGPGFNYRMPSINSALGCAQIEMLSYYIVEERIIVERYEEFFNCTAIQLFREPDYAH